MAFEAPGGSQELGGGSETSGRFWDLQMGSGEGSEGEEEEEEVYLPSFPPAVGSVCPELCLKAAELFMPGSKEISSV